MISKGVSMNQQNEHKGLIIGVVVVVILAIAGWSVYALQNANDRTPETRNVEPNTSAPADSTDETTTTQGESATITFTDDGFTPRDITVQRGTTVTIKNESSESVQFSSDDHPSHRDNSEMNLGTLSPGESTTYTANTPGVWGYHDHLNDSLTGTITVRE